MRVLGAALMVSFHAPLFAHDFWIEPATFSPRPGQVVDLRLREGENFAGEILPRDFSHSRRFISHQGGVSKAVEGRQGRDPAGRVVAAGHGPIIVGYHSHWRHLELPAGKFEDYLREEGLEAVVASRALRKQSNAAGVEMYSRCAKSLVRVGAPAGGVAFDQRLELPMELMAERDPYRLDGDRVLPLRLLFEGRPIAEVLVKARSSTEPSRVQTARTDRDGRVRFALASDGAWLINAVHMIDAPPGSGADWASYWASLTFAAPYTTTGVKPPPVEARRSGQQAVNPIPPLS